MNQKTRSEVVRGLRYSFEHGMGSRSIVTKQEKRNTAASDPIQG